MERIWMLPLGGVEKAGGAIQRLASVICLTGIYRFVLRDLPIRLTNAVINSLISNAQDLGVLFFSHHPSAL
jgi:hypothetical protein